MSSARGLNHRLISDLNPWVERPVTSTDSARPPLRERPQAHLRAPGVRVPRGSGSRSRARIGPAPAAARCAPAGSGCKAPLGCKHRQPADDRFSHRRTSCPRFRSATVPIVARRPPVAVTAGDHRTVCSPQPAAADRRPRIRGVAPPRTGAAACRRGFGNVDRKRPSTSENAERCVAAGSPVSSCAARVGAGDGRLWRGVSAY